jgi:hypothetical protein
MKVKQITISLEKENNKIITYDVFGERAIQLLLLGLLPTITEVCTDKVALKGMRMSEGTIVHG